VHPYAVGLFCWSRAILFVVVPLVTRPLVVWVAAHVTAAMAMPGWPLKLLVLFSWPFVDDLTSGNVVVFSLLLAAWAIRGNRFSTGAYLLLTLLIPRPMALPVLALLLWRRPWVRIPFLVMLVAHGTVVLALDPHLHWIGQLLTSLGDVHNWFNFGPSAWIGSLWIPIGAALAVIFTKRGHLGMASLAASPYWLAYYLQFGLLEFVKPPDDPLARAHAAPAADAIEPLDLAPVRHDGVREALHALPPGAAAHWWRPEAGRNAAAGVGLPAGWTDGSTADRHSAAEP